MLTDAECRNACCPPDKKHARFADSGGLYLQVDLNGSRRWFWKYRLGGLEKRLALGGYPIHAKAYQRTTHCRRYIRLLAWSMPAMHLERLSRAALALQDERQFSFCIRTRQNSLPTAMRLPGNEN